jgi:hypothetical protein
MRVVATDQDFWRRGFLSVRNYYILDRASLYVEVTALDEKNLMLTHNISFWQSNKQHTEMVPIKGDISFEDIDGGRLYWFSGKQFKEQEDYRIDIATGDVRMHDNSEVIFHARIFSKDIQRREASLVLWTLVIGIALLIVGHLLNLFQIIPFWQISITP